MVRSDSHFYQNTSFIDKLLTIFIKGDKLVLYPFWLLVILLAVFYSQYAIMLSLVFLSLRFLIEAIYWLLQQFVGGKYRPGDYGFTKLSNNSIYIIYQLTSTVSASLFICLLIIYLTHAN